MGQSWTWKEGNSEASVELEAESGTLIWSRYRASPTRQDLLLFMSRPKAPFPFRCPGPTIEAVQRAGAAWLAATRLPDPGQKP